MMKKNRMLIFLIFYFLVHASTTCSQNEKRRVLILGGNGFLGSHLVRILSEDENQNYDITALNRGNVYFNSDKESLSYVDRILTCDRNTLLRRTCPGLVGKSKYDAVIDFSSYTGQQIEQVIDILKGRVGVYVLVSSDAVYEVSEKYHEGRTREEDSRNQPKEQKARDKLEENNKYGTSKKEAEERLFEQRDKLGFPYVVLRLADAIGGRFFDIALNKKRLYEIVVKSHAHP